MGNRTEPRDLLLITLGFPPARGGIQSCLYARALRADARIVVLGPAVPGAPAFDAGQPMPICRWPAWWGDAPGIKRVCQISFSLIWAWRLRRRYPIRRIECGQALPFGVVAWLFRVVQGVPYRVWAFGDDIIKPAGWPMIRWLLVHILRRAEMVIAISQFTRGHLRALGVPDEQIRVIHPLLDLERFRFVPPAGDDHAPKILTVARLEWRKGIHVVLQALPALRKLFPHLTYTVVGDGLARDELKCLANRLGVGDCVHFAGEVAEEDLPSYYQACDVFAMFPTPAEEKGEAEGFGMVYLEAAACGRPSVAWRTGGVEEAVLHRRTGLLVGKGDVDSAREAIEALLLSPERRREMGKAARIWAEEIVNRSLTALAALDDGHESRG